MATPMRESPLDGGHRGKVADPNTKSNANSAAVAANNSANTASGGAVVPSSNFEYDDNEWDIGIGNLIIDLDADIEKTNDKGGGSSGAPPHHTANNNTINNNNNFSMASTPTTGQPTKSAKLATSASPVEHSATVDKGLKMKIKRTKPGTKEAKHEIVKPPVDGSGVPSGGTPGPGGGGTAMQNGDDKSNNSGSKHPPSTGVSKRGSSGGHRRDKAREKHAEKQSPALTKSAEVNGVLPTTPAPVPVVVPSSVPTVPASTQVTVSASAGPQPSGPSGSTVVAPISAQQQQQQAAVLSTAVVSSAGPTVGPSVSVTNVQSVVPSVPNPPVPTPSVLQQPPTAASDLPPALNVAGSTANPTPTPTVAPSATKPEASKNANCEDNVGATSAGNTSPPPAKKLKPTPTPPTNNTTVVPAIIANGTDSKLDVNDVCVGTSVGTITEPDCLGPCEPGTSVTLEGIVWHETEGGVLVVNVTWRGKTYVGTLLDCTKHDWAPPRFCDSPTSDLDARTPKGRGKRGRAAATTPANDLSNFTETRSSVHSKLRNGAKGRRGAAGSPAPPTVPAFATPRPDTNNKRKGRASETEDSPAPASNGAGGKRSRSGSRGPPTSPPASPVLLECPEPNCSKKYKHINGLKYHQSHAHGGGEEDSLLDSKDATSLSENDESNAEPPSVPPSPSPEKGSPVPKAETRKEDEVVSRAVTPPCQNELDKPILKPGVLRFGPTEEPTSHFPVGVYCTSASNNVGTKPVINIPTPPSVKQAPAAMPSAPPAVQSSPDTTSNKLCDKYKVKIPPPPQRTVVALTTSSLKPVQPSIKPTLLPELSDKTDKSKQSALQPSPPQQMTGSPSKKKARKSPASSPQPDMHNGMYLETSPLALATPSEGREDVQSPAYSDISDDAAPMLESEVGDKGTPKSDKKVESQPSLGHYGMYPYYGQPPYLVPSVTSVPENKNKEVEKRVEEVKEKEKEKKDAGVPVSTPNPTDFQQKILQQPTPQPQQPHYYPPYPYPYPYNMDAGYPMSVMADKYMEPPEALERPKSLSDKDKVKEIKEEKLASLSMDSQSSKMTGSSGSSKESRPIIKSEPSNLKEKQNENHQILKESIEMKSQMNDKSKFSSYDTSPYMYQRQAEELRRYYLYPEQQQQQQTQQQVQQQSQQQQSQQQQQQQQQQARRKEAQPLDATVSKEKNKTALPSPKPQGHKEKTEERQVDKKDQEKKQEGVKPTMETQGPPPPTSSYAYIHPGYMQSPHYGPLPFDPNHPMYRGINPMIVPAAYSTSPYLHPQMRYHGPEDLSRGPPAAPTKALDMLQHHASQYYSSHKIHELQERALKSPTPKTGVPPPPSSQPPAPQPTSQQQPPQSTPPNLPASVAGASPAVNPGALPPGKDGKDAPAQIRSPPPQRHVHTHHHTHVGLGYPLLPGQYPAPYGGKPLVRP